MPGLIVAVMLIGGCRTVEDPRLHGHWKSDAKGTLEYVEQLKGKKVRAAHAKHGTFGKLELIIDDRHITYKNHVCADGAYPYRVKRMDTNAVVVIMGRNIISSRYQTFEFDQGGLWSVVGTGEDAMKERFIRVHE